MAVVNKEKIKLGGKKEGRQKTCGKYGRFRIFIFLSEKDITRFISVSSYRVKCLPVIGFCYKRNKYAHPITFTFRSS